MCQTINKILLLLLLLEQSLVIRKLGDASTSCISSVVWLWLRFRQTTYRIIHPPRVPARFLWRRRSHCSATCRGSRQKTVPGTEIQRTPRASATWVQPLVGWRGSEHPQNLDRPPTFYIAFWWIVCDYVTNCTKRLDLCNFFLQKGINTLDQGIGPQNFENVVWPLFNISSQTSSVTATVFALDGKTLYLRQKLINEILLLDN